MQSSKGMLGWFLALILVLGLGAALRVRNYLAKAAEERAPRGPALAAGTNSSLVDTGPPRHGAGSSQVPARGAWNPSRRAPLKLGLSINDPKAFQGHTLLVSTISPKTYLIDMQGRVVRTWESDCPPALSAYLLENGYLLRSGSLTGEPHHLNGPGAGGRIQEFTWDGQLVWDFTFARDKQLPHHDLTHLPNGNVLLIAWDEKTGREAVAAGRRDMRGDGSFLPDCLIEIKPTGKTTGEVVWEWHIWDHLIQDHDRSMANFGNVAAHPERIDVNFGESPMPTVGAQQAGIDKLRSIGYVGSTTGKRPPRVGSDWTHVNSVAYNAEFDQVMLSVHAFSEIWVIDHSTTRAEAAGPTGGRSGKGGDLLYRWGNPLAHRAGTGADRQLYFPHNADWIPRGLPGEGHALVFNNGARRPGGPFSSVDEIALPVDDQGRYSHKLGAAFGPERPVWSYTAPNKIEFYSFLLSGAQRLPNGNTLICSGMSGTIFEVTPEREIVWQYTCPVTVKTGASGPTGSMGFGPAGGSALFRAYRYGPDHHGLAGKDLTPGKTVEELQPKNPDA